MTVTLFKKRKSRVRRRLRKNAAGKIRLSVFRSNQHVYAQLIDDVKGITLAQASTRDSEVGGKLNSLSSKEAAKAVGSAIAEKAKANKISIVVFDRGGYLYHGRVKALADAARESGLVF